jgi:hypothetical protein
MRTLETIPVDQIDLDGEHPVVLAVVAGLSVLLATSDEEAANAAITSVAGAFIGPLVGKIARIFKPVAPKVSQKLLALGRNTSASGKPLLKPFAERIGAKRVLDLHTPRGLDLPSEIALRMEGADQIHFNLAELGDLERVLTEGRSFYPGSSVRYTSWEFSKLIDNAALRSKTFFHLENGKMVQGLDFTF